MTFGITMSSATTLLQSDVESSSTTSEADTSSLEAALTTTHTVKMLMDKGESKVSYGYSFETSKSSDVCQLRIKPLSLKFRPRYEAAGDEFWRAGLQLASMASSQQVSCDWRISRHVTTVLISDWSAGGGGVRCHAEGGSVLRPCWAVHQVRMFYLFVYS